jgi:hypothetical protein
MMMMMMMILITTIEGAVEGNRLQTRITRV